MWINKQVWETHNKTLQFLKEQNLNLNNLLIKLGNSIPSKSLENSSDKIDKHNVEEIAKVLDSFVGKKEFDDFKEQLMTTIEGVVNSLQDIDKKLPESESKVNECIDKVNKCVEAIKAVSDDADKRIDEVIEVLKGLTKEEEGVDNDNG